MENLMIVICKIQKKTNCNAFYFLKSFVLEKKNSKKKAELFENVKSEFSDKIIKKQKEMHFYEEKIKENEMILSNLIKGFEICEKIIQEKEKSIENLNKNTKIKKINNFFEKMEAIENQV